ncbi:MAG: N-acetylmuramoyl-L-alanine amidase [bacterium]|nr:N-acetylmuramoyl-L-alanine amidase [bacterium]
MTKKPAIHAFFIALLSVMLLLASSTILHAETVTFGGTVCAHPYISRDGGIFIALSDIESRLGVNSLYDGTRLILGGTIHGTIVVDPNSHTLNIGNNGIDFRHNLIYENGEWYAPEEFISKALGVTSKMDVESGDLFLYPLVVSISPCGNYVQIESSIAPVYQAFELADPPRRVIDISGSYLDGDTLAVNGTDIGVSGVRQLRASQWQDDPPIVRVVFEWASDPAPGHTVFPDNKSLSVLIGSNITGATPCSDINILHQPMDPVNPPAPVIPDPNPNPVPVDPPSNPDVDIQQGPEVRPDNEVVEPAGNPLFQNPLVNPPISPPAPIPIEVPPAPVVPVENPVPANPDNGDNIPLSQLGWDVAFEMNPEGEITATITAPAFQEVSDFTIAGDGMRIVLDLKGTVLQGHGERNLTGLGEISGLRIGQFDENTTRIVFDMGRVVAYDLQSDPAAGKIIVRLLKGDLIGKTICIDPGHGGRDSGAEGPTVNEKDLNLEMAMYLKEYLEEQGAHIIMTRTADEYITLPSRISIARQSPVDMYVCIHNNSTEEPTALQGSLFLFSDENFMPLYRLVHRGVAARTGVPGLGPVEDERGLYILRQADGIPVVFVEGGFMTNPVDYARLTDSSRLYSKNIMLGVMDGILAYYSGRDLPAVKYPDYGTMVDVGIFDLVGTPLVINHDGDTGSAWDSVPLEETASDDSSDETSSDDDSETDDSTDDDDSYHRLRGRGAYRY